MGDADEGSRRIVAVVHLAMLAAIPLYAGALALFRGSGLPVRPAAERLRFVSVLLVIGAVEWAVATLVGRRWLVRGGGGSASDRVRRYFLIRFAAGEAMAVFGLFAGFTGVRWAEAGLLFAAAALALVLSAPTRAAWDTANRLADAGP